MSKSIKIGCTLLISCTLLLSSNTHSAIGSKGYSFNAPKLAARTAATTKAPIPYETIKHHTRHKKYHSALSVSREVSTVTVSFHTKQELIDLRGPQVNGFSLVRRDGSCEIHVMMPYNWNDNDAMRTVGHELMHCFGAAHEKSRPKTGSTLQSVASFPPILPSVAPLELHIAGN
ncbi:MAG: hypothetical protein HOL04_02655 [Gammaproteobacteria bacterium]|jgi:hypothetical protein|nr:hypothetical protein [Gammaproteobacteria bacterium]MBT4606072.1 hypothetical protein [Thiotrichales bacterium]MBT3471875.1 hypothetical protein [Gammaproteobacteria bacterium]MBT3967122.1 hypothetical protein [Gammaproteobacteria bacterium]MBT4082018.1 hypothetical protein [Gammaproteobacteria bacterium]